MLMKTTNGIVTKYVYGLGLIGEEKDACFKTYHFDSRGSTVAITDEACNIVDTFAYDAYGKVTSHIGSSFVIFGYNGRDGVVTDNNGLIYMRARYYSPEMKRFINADIIHGDISDSTSLNRYAYVNGNPVSFVDPFGLSKDERDKLSEEDYNNVLKILNDTLAPSNELLWKKMRFMKKEPLLNMVYDIKIGNTRYYGSFTHTFGKNEIDLNKFKEIWEGQIEISSSFDFTQGTFKVTSKNDQISISYSAKIDDYNTATATILLQKDGSFSGEYEIETVLNDHNGNTFTSTFGIEKTLSNTLPPLPVPVVVPNSEEKREFSWQDILDTAPRTNGIPSLPQIAPSPNEALLFSTVFAIVSLVLFKIPIAV